jgi:hypothetical protein
MTNPVDDNRSAGWARAAAWALVLAGLLLFMMFGRVPDETLFWEDFYHAGHVPLFGFVALSILGLLQARGRSLARPRTWWTAFVAAVALGAATETLQLAQPGRDASVWHFLRNVAGAASFLLVVATFGWMGRQGSLIRSASRRAIVAIGVVAMLGAAGFDLAATVVRYGERDMALPTLFALDGSWRERPFVETRQSVLTPGARPAGATAGFDEPMARLDFEPGTYPGLVLDEPYPDWRWARSLELTFYSDLDAPLPLVIRVHDAWHDNRYADRFNRRIVVRPGFSRVVIPLEDVRRAPDQRRMDLRHIRQIMLFAYRLTAPTHVFVGPIRLGN